MANVSEDYIEKLDAELENQIKLISSLEPGEERAKEIKNLEVMSAIRTDILQKQTENYAAEMKVEQDDKKIQQDSDRAVADKKQAKATIILNGIMTAISALGSIGVPIWIMTAERRGQFWSNRALNATEKPPRLQFIKLPFIKK